MKADLTIEYDPAYLASLVERNKSQSDLAWEEIAQDLDALAAKVKCLKHRFHPTARFCPMCDAKRKSNGKFEAARREFVNRDFSDYGYKH